MKNVFFLSGIFLLLFCNPIGAQTFQDDDFSIFNIASGWVRPVGAQFSTDGKQLFVWERGGRVYVCNRNGSGVYIKQATPVLDLANEVAEWGDHGLLGFALDPNFTGNGLIYLLYVVDRRSLFNNNSIPVEDHGATIGRVTRYKTIINGSDNLVLDPNPAERVILIGESPSTGIPMVHDSHGLGTLAFAADGTLLISAGDGASFYGADGGSFSLSYWEEALDVNNGGINRIMRDEENVGAFRAQMLNSHNGKLLRINPVTGDGVSSNPFYSAAEPRAPKSRVWAFGFRNPFRFSIRPGTGSIDPSTGDLGEIYVGDVSWNGYEELNIIKAPGMNCGWPLYEGHTILNDYSNLNTVNRDEPNPLYNSGGCTQQYFMFKNLLKQATADGISTVYNSCNTSQPIGTGSRYFHRRPAIDWKHGENSSRVGKFIGNNASTSEIGTPESGVIGTPFQGKCAIGGCWYTGTLFPANFRDTYFMADFDEQMIKSLKIDFTDIVQQVQDFASNLGHESIAYLIENPLDGTLVYVDIGSQAVKTITYGGNQFPVVKMSSDKTYGTSPLTVNFTGNTSFDPDNNNPITYAWNFDDPTSGVNNTSTLANPSHTFTFGSGPKKYAVKFTVTDNGSPAKSSTDSIIVSVNNTPPDVAITSPIKNSTYTLGGDTAYTLSATVTDEEHNAGQLKYAWQTILRHNNHQHAGAIDTSRNSFATIGRPGCNGENYYWYVELTVTDGAGLSTIDSSSIYPACASAPLPLLLRKFSVTQQGNENLVKWTTESEMNIEYFEVERSTDGFNFSPVNQTPASNTAGPNEYSFTDHTFPVGVNYYRLKIVEAGSIIKYSVIVKTFFEIMSEGLVISPNPVINDFSVSYTATGNGPVIIRISDINGRLINTIHESVNRGQNIIYLQSTHALKPGIYLVSVQQGDGIQHGKFIKAE